jgi:hypothetical protein
MPRFRIDALSYLSSGTILPSQCLSRNVLVGRNHDAVRLCIALQVRIVSPNLALVECRLIPFEAKAPQATTKVHDGALAPPGA